MGIARGQVPTSRGRGPAAAAGTAGRVALMMRGFKMAPGACHRVDLVTSVKESCIIFILSSSHFGKKEEHAIIIVKVDFYHIFITFKSRFKCGG